MPSCYPPYGGAGLVAIVCLSRPKDGGLCGCIRVRSAAGAREAARWNRAGLEGGGVCVDDHVQDRGAVRVRAFAADNHARGAARWPDGVRALEQIPKAQRHARPRLRRRCAVDAGEGSRESPTRLLARARRAVSRQSPGLPWFVPTRRDSVSGLRPDAVLGRRHGKGRMGGVPRPRGGGVSVSVLFEDWQLFLQRGRSVLLRTT